MVSSRTIATATLAIAAGSFLAALVAGRVRALAVLEVATLILLASTIVGGGLCLADRWINRTR